MHRFGLGWALTRTKHGSYSAFRHEVNRGHRCSPGIVTGWRRRLVSAPERSALMHKWAFSLTAACLLAAGVVSGANSASADVGAVPSQVPAGTPIYLNRSYSPVERAVDLTSRMTLAEKAAQMD